MAADSKGKVLTVLGPIDPTQLGRTMSHDHILIDGSQFFTPPEYVSHDMENLDFELCHSGKIRQYPYAMRKNIVLDSISDAVDELKLFRQAGGGTICDVTTVGIRCKTEDLPQISRESGVNIIMGTGYYVGNYLSEDVKMMTSNEMADCMVKEIEEGIGDSGVRCGVIGEIGCSYPLMDCEKRALQAAAMAQTRTGAPLIIHPGRDDRSPFEIVSIIESAGGSIHRTVMSHLDRTLQDREKLLEFARLGGLLEYDHFGNEISHCQYYHDVDMFNDAQRIQNIKFLVENGFSDKIVVGHDIHTKHVLTKYGGHGYGHFLESVVPKMIDRGIPPETVNKLTVENPRQWLTFV